LATEIQPQQAAATGDPEQVATQQDFGRELTAARTSARLTVRQVARTAGLPISTAGDYFSGRHLPAYTQPEPLLKLLRACGVTDPEQLAGWTEALRRARRPAGRRAASDAPYRGLARFEAEDARWFFGREEITERLVRLAADGDPDLPIVLVGPSGSGKSSLLRAGLASHLDGPVLFIEPSATPLASLEEQLASAVEAGDPELPAVIVDQLEALFTECHGESERRAFLTRVVELASDRLVVLALRADFYLQALRYPPLARALQSRQLVVGPMTAAQVRRVITEPARLARLDVEDGLVELLLRDLAPRGPRPGLPPDEGSGSEAAAYDIGTLPLLSHAMLATWEHSRGGVLTIADYLASGGISGALIRTAEGAYGSLTEDQQRLAGRLFLRLVHVAGSLPPTSTTAQVGDLRSWAGPEAEQVLSIFVRARLITVDADTAQITHDALLTAWPRLRSWIEAGREDLRVERRIVEAAQSWQDAGREDAALWRGSQLAVAREWAANADHRASLGTLAAAFVDAAVAEDEARERAARRRTRRLQRLVAALTVLVLAVCGLTAYTFHQRDEAAAARTNADSREVALEADQLRGQDSPLAAQLSVAAYEFARTPQSLASLLDSSATPSAASLIDSPDLVQSVSLNPARSLLAAAAANGTLRLWNVGTPGNYAPVGMPLEQAAGALYATAFSPDGDLLAAAGSGRTISLWDVSKPAHPVRLGAPLTGPANTIYTLAFSPDGKILAAGSADDTVRLWNVSNPADPRLLGAPIKAASGYVESIAFAPDGTLLAVGSADKTVRLWDIAVPSRPAAVGKPLTGPADLVTSVAFSPDGHLLAAGSQDDKVWLWRISPATTARNVAASPDGTLTGATDWVNSVAFSPDSDQLAAGSSDASVLVWNLATRSLTATLPQPQPVTSLEWDGTSRLVDGDADGTVSVWSLPTPVLMAGSPAFDAVYNPDGALLAVSSQDDLELWSTASRQLLQAKPAPATFVNVVEFAPHGNVLATGYGDGMMQLWRATATALTPLGPPVRAAASALEMVESLSFSPNGRELVTGADDGTIRLWSVSNPAHPLLQATEQDSRSQVLGVAFAPGGRTVAATSGDNLTRLWNVADPSRPVEIGKPLAGLSSYAISVTFSPDGKLLAVGSADKTVQLWDVADPAHPRLAAPPLSGPTSYVYGVAFSPDGKTLAAGVTDGTVWLWNVSDSARPSLLGTLAGPTGHVYSVAFSPSGKQLAAASADGTVRLWDTSAVAAARSVCTGAGQPLTRQEWATYIQGVSYHAPCP
jgi:WD40 repeat protein/transcriptional regulator with XRE-family HTH domain